MEEVACIVGFVALLSLQQLMLPALVISCEKDIRSENCNVSVKCKKFSGVSPSKVSVVSLTAYVGYLNNILWIGISKQEL